MTDKIIVTNRTAMAIKYRNNLTPIDQALARLSAADAGRGLTTITIDIGNAAQMSTVGGQAVINAADERGAKNAVDAIFAKHNPDYLLLLDGPDVVPHILLNSIPGLQADPDIGVPSDLPYASPAKFSRTASRFLAVTRVVGRLPMVEGASEPSELARLIDNAAQHLPSPQTGHSAYFAISAQVWQQSTQMSLNAIFGNHASLSVSPTASHPNINRALARKMHFINCHGDTIDPQFYGEALGQRPLPVAMDSLRTQPQITAGTVAAAECCYGAQLYDHVQAGMAPAMCISYLLGGAIAFLGSTNIAYGPAAANLQADLLTQYFLINVLAGDTTGGALLKARQQFVMSQKMAGATNLKTLAQFILLGDPSLRPCNVLKESTSIEMTGEADPDFQRKASRMALAGQGAALAKSATFPGKTIAATDAVGRSLRDLAARRNFDATKMVVMDIAGGSDYVAATKGFGTVESVATIVDVGPTEPSGFQPVRVLTAFLSGGRIVKVEEVERR